MVKGLRTVELGRPVLLVAAYVLLERWLGWWAAPLAGVAVFAVALLVHDLIHNALALPGRVNDAVLAAAALFLIKSGHALRESHVRHHQKCLDDDDEEGRVAHESIPRLMLTGPWLALRARWSAFRGARARSRAWQLGESAVNAAAIALLLLAGRGGWIYLGAVILVTVSAPIWGAKIPHTLPTGHPWVRWLRDHAGRFTPAACSVLFHELHHRSPRVPVALLAARRAEIEARPPSPCPPNP